MSITTNTKNMNIITTNTRHMKNMNIITMNTGTAAVGTSTERRFAIQPKKALPCLPPRHPYASTL